MLSFFSITYEAHHRLTFLQYRKYILIENTNRASLFIDLFLLSWLILNLKLPIEDLGTGATCMQNVVKIVWIALAITLTILHRYTKLYTHTHTHISWFLFI